MKERIFTRKRVALLLIACGVLLLLLAAALELSRYPWRAAVGVSSDLPDPPPIVLSPEDEGARLITEETAESAPPQAEEEYAQLPGDEEVAAIPDAYMVLGVIKIPRLEVSEHLLEGTARQLRYGVGHLTGTAAVGAAGNAALAAHRNLSFRYLDLLRAGDSVVITVGGDSFVYTVYSSFEVEPDALWVLDPVEGESRVLTLITCTPYLVSSHRLIVRARLTEVNGLAPAEFYGE